MFEVWSFALAGLVLVLVQLGVPEKYRQWKERRNAKNPKK